MISKKVVPAAVIDRVAARLAPTGLNRCQAAPVATLPASVWLDGRDAPSSSTGGASHPTGIDGREHATLLLVGHGGRTLWNHLHNPDEFDFDGTPDPIDTFSISETEKVLADELPTVDRHLLYPHPDCPVDLVALGVHLGWQSPSPLGLGITPTYGLWSAFRALWLLRAETGERTPMASPDICATCSHRSCVDACPARAVMVGQEFALMACIDHRSTANSSCAERCLSREACPVGSEHRYESEQISYHYRLSRPTGSGHGHR